jgi:hypothetical protein
MSATNEERWSALLDSANARTARAEAETAEVRILLDATRAHLVRSESSRRILAGALAECFECMETTAQAIPDDTPFRRVSAEALREVAQDGRTALHHAQGAAEGEA